MTTLDRIDTPSGLDIYHIGPPLVEGALPTLFYFALSAHESLTVDPYNQPIAYLNGKPIRAFSSNLPFHVGEYNPNEAVLRWGEAITQGKNILQEFIDQTLANIHYLIDQKWVDRDHFAVAGLSRGGFIALHLAQADPLVNQVIGYAPGIILDQFKGFPKLADSTIMQSMVLDHKKFIHKDVRLYIGNRDERVGTDNCYHFLKEVTWAAFYEGVRSPTIEMMISTSIGHKGHGTSKKIFEDGVKWFIEKNGLNS